MLSNSKRFPGGNRPQGATRQSGTLLPGRAKMSLRAPSMSTVAKVVGRLKGKNGIKVKIITTNPRRTKYPECTG